MVSPTEIDRTNKDIAIFVDPNTPLLVLEIKILWLDVNACVLTMVDTLCVKTESPLSEVTVVKSQKSHCRSR